MSHQDQKNGPSHAGPSGETILSHVAAQPEGWALFLDIDGTLIDLAETPDGIVVPDGLAGNLQSLSDHLGGALALVTGRALPYADRLFAPHRFPIAGLHGAERRDAAGTISRFEPDAAFEILKAEMVTEAGRWPGVLIEDKGAAVAAHYRRAPEAKDEVEAMMQRALASAGADFALQFGKMVIEIRPAVASKGRALEAFLGEAPFAGRRPIAIGDDVTDEAMFRTVNAMGGHSIRITDDPTQPTEAQAVIASAEDLRRQIALLAGPRTVFMK
ncbi:MAG: trehalose-phosphatase [Neorhizobium sp.]|jgi:trehalose 6-phosphate phosphatase|nr:trehalose-phosphatase [Neorhizobium sp.]